MIANVTNILMCYVIKRQRRARNAPISTIESAPLCRVVVNVELRLDQFY